MQYLREICKARETEEKTLPVAEGRSFDHPSFSVSRICMQFTFATQSTRNKLKFVWWRRFYWWWRWWYDSTTSDGDGDDRSETIEGRMHGRWRLGCRCRLPRRPVPLQICLSIHWLCGPGQSFNQPTGLQPLLLQECMQDLAAEWIGPPPPAFPIRTSCYLLILFLEKKLSSNPLVTLWTSKWQRSSALFFSLI